MSNFNHTQYFPHKNVATVGAGGRWLGVYNELDRYNVTVVGGRVVDVGVGGLILGCELMAQEVSNIWLMLYRWTFIPFRSLWADLRQCRQL